MATVTETILADVQVKGLDNFGKLKVSMDTVAKSSEKASKGIETIKVQAARAGKALGVNTKIARRFVNTALQAGFAAEDQAKAMAKIKEVAEKTGKPVEIIEKAWEGLARTLQNADDATDNLEDALRFQARSGIPEAEKAAAKYAQTIGGGTDALKGLTGVGEMYAKQLDHIRDADLKARLTTQLARKELNRKRESIERVKDSYLAMSLQMKAALGPSNLLAIKMMTKALTLLAYAAGALLVGAFALAVKAIKEFIETDEVMKSKLDILKKSVDDLQVALGSALVGGSKNAGKAFDDLTGKTKTLTKFVNENADAIFEMAKTFVSAVATTLEAGVKLIMGFRMIGAVVTDVMELMAATATWAFTQIARVAMESSNAIWDHYQKVIDTQIMVAEFLGVTIPKSIKNIDLTSQKEDLTEIIALQDVASKRVSQGFLNSQAVLSDTNKLDVMIAKLREAAGATAEVVPPQPPDPDPKGKGKEAEGPFVFGDGVGGAGPAFPGTLEATIGQDQDSGPGWLGSMMQPAMGMVEDSFGLIREEVMTTADVFSKFFADMDQGMIDMGISMTQNFAGSAAQAFGAAAASSASFGAAMKDLIKSTLAQAAIQFGQFFVLKGTAIALDPLLGGPAVGLPIVAQGLALQAFGGAIGAMGGGGGKGGKGAAPAAANMAAFQPREQAKEEPKETTLVINIAGETVGPAIWRAMDEGVRLGHVTQFA